MQDEVKVREIETVAGDFLTEAGVPFYRVEIDGFCADFDYREAAENFANAINQMVARHRHQAERETLARMEWRDIESAPHETEVLLAWHDWLAEEWKMEVACYSTGKRYENGYSSFSCHGQATYWQPLPPAPEAGQ